jgi:hypothetical protein
MTDQYNTPLPADRQAPYAAWRASLPRDLQNTSDYDLQGAFQRHAQVSGRAHLDDGGKKPNHMTFSSGSTYSAPDQPGGNWTPTGKYNPETKEDQSVFWPTPFNMSQHSASDMADYFRRQEPGNPVVLPYSYSLPPGAR